MKKILKIIFINIFWINFSINFSIANYILFYGKGCPHCAEVEEYISSHNLNNKIQKIEIYFSQTGKDLFIKSLQKLNLNPLQVSVPFLYIPNENKYIEGTKSIIEYFKTHKIGNSQNSYQGCTINQPCNNKENTQSHLKPDNFNTNYQSIRNQHKKILSIIGVLILSAFTDSINPCALAVMAILLTTILLRYKDIRKVIFTGICFTIAVFLSYYLMGLGVLTIISKHTNGKIGVYIKYIIGILGIIIGLANLKDSIRYGKLFVMEVPFSRRPYLKKTIQKVTSPLGGFFIGLIVSLFLLPCTAGPYIFFNGYLATYNINVIIKYILLGLYNLIFILPMIGITLLVAFGITQPNKILEKKDKYIKLIHFVVGIILILLGIYVLLY